MAAEAAEVQAPGPAADEEILVIGTRIIEVQPERSLDQEGIESYGQSTVDELLAEVQAELGEEEPPLILVNGERVTDIGDIGALPVEVLDKLKILPRGSAVRAGGSPGQRIVSLTLKPTFRAATVLVAPRVATMGSFFAGRGEAALTYVRDSTRANLTFKGRLEGDVLESDRDIEQPDPTLPYARQGNVVGFPNTSGEIDPLFSLAAGELVTVAAIPDSANPGLNDFAANANQAATTDLGEFRTLRPKLQNYDLNGTFATRLAPWLTGTVGIRLNHSTRRSLRGLPSALFVLAPTNPSSPFSTSVGLTEYGGNPLTTRTERDSGEVNLSLNGRFGDWTSFFTVSQLFARDVTKTERQSVTGAVLVPDSVDPFADDLFALVPIRTDRAEAKTSVSNARLSFTGPLVRLPAGAAQATLEAQYLRNRLRAENEFAVDPQGKTFKRTTTGLRGAIDLPLTSATEGALTEIGELSANAEYSLVNYSDTSGVHNYQLGLAWEPRPVLRLSADFEKLTFPASVQMLAMPIVATSGVRTFDPVTGETVDVTQITGGNRGLDPEKTTVRRVAALLRLVEEWNLQLDAEYTDTRERNFISALPEASALTMLAFPDRYIRDPDGNLTIVDIRPVNFDEHREKRLRYGISFNRRLGGADSIETAAADGPADDTSPGQDASPRRARPGIRVSFTASHSIVFSDKIFIRAPLPAINLLEGGAIGIGGGRVRHQVDATASVTSGGAGLRMSADWRGRSTLNAFDEAQSDELRFSPQFILNLKAFTDLKRFFPDSGFAKGARLSLNVANLTNDRQEVRDADGNTPLSYQKGYRDPLGRTVELELRKVF